MLWIGYIKWQLKTGGQDVVRDPVLRDFHNIECRDAVLDYSAKTLRMDEEGKPVTRWDGETTKPHPVTGENVPDESARREIYDYENPKPAVWPEADFIVGNPPFIGGKDLRAELGDGYAEALWAAHGDMPKSADFVMYWWNQAARRVAAGAKAGGGGRPRRFGFITTNSIRQTFNRRVIEKALSGKPPLSLIYAIPDHPWMKSADKAAVRIAMTVAAPGEERDGVLAEVVEENGLNTDQPEVRLAARVGLVGPALRLGAKISAAKPLLANAGISSPGVKLHGSGFIVTPEEAQRLDFDRQAIGHVIHPYRNGRDLNQKARGVMVIDLFGLSEDDVRDRYPAIYQHLYDTVRSQREGQARKSSSRDALEYFDRWWTFGKPRQDLRVALEGLTRFVATAETSKHRFFSFLPVSTRPDNKLIAVANESATVLAMLSSKLHVVWSDAAGGRLGVGNDPVYAKSDCFDPFPFPDLTDKPALKARLDELGERLDAHRKSVLDKHGFLTMTRLYNVLERVRALEAGKDNAPPLTEAEKDIYEAGLVGTLKSIHEDIDAAVFEAYGWPADLDDEAILERLVALNLERHEEEKQGRVRWLRPDFQIPRFAPKSARAAQGDLALDGAAVETGGKLPAFPAGDRKAQARIVRELLEGAGGPVSADELARRVAGKNTRAKIGRVQDVLDVMEAVGQAETDSDGRYFLGG